MASRCVYPLKVAANRRYLIDRRGTPFLIVGDSPQALIANLTEKEAAMYLANRHAAGFNAVWVNLLCNTYTGGRPDGTTYDGLRPFTRPGDLAIQTARTSPVSTASSGLQRSTGSSCFSTPSKRAAGWTS